MTATPNPFRESPVPVLPPETSPAAIRDALVDEKRAEFERAYRAAIAEAAETLDLTSVFAVLRAYHQAIPHAAVQEMIDQRLGR